MLKPKDENRVPPRDRLQRRSAALMANLLLAGVAVAAQPGSNAAADVDALHAPRANVYRVVNLGTDSFAAAINARGQVAFTEADPWSGQPPQSWFYDGARLHAIGNLGGTFSRTSGLNDAGQVTGISETADGFIHAFVWSKKRGITDVGTLPGMNESWEPVINNRGEVAGYSTGDPSPPYPHAFRWSAKTGIEDLGLLLPGESSTSYATAINDAGLIAGFAWAGDSTYHAFLWSRAGGMIDIDTLGNHRSYPVAVGAKGQVAGNTTNPPDNVGSVFWWTAATGMRDLGPGNGIGSWMTDMSSGGRIAGVIIYPGFSQHAMTWTPQSGLRDLGTLGGQQSNANGANNRGQVVGGAVTSDDQYRAFVWTEREGMVDLNRRLYRPPAGLVLNSALAISDNGSIVALSNAGLVLLTPHQPCSCKHAAGPIVATDLVQVGAAVDTSLFFTSEDSSQRYQVTWSWGDGTTERAREASASKGTGSASARHSYAMPGIYTVTANVTDQTGHSVKVGRRIVVYEPSKGAIGGNGSIVLPATTGGHAAKLAGGKAQFSFVAPPAGKARTGNANGYFQFSLPGLSFASRDIQVVASAGHARLAGMGQLNGRGNYHFTANTSTGAVQGKSGRFSVKIWHTDPKTGAEIVDFDTRTDVGAAGGSPIAEGSIMVQ